jgi:probable HAF family extracellular repeat protein
MPVYTYTTLDEPLQLGFTTSPGGINDAGQIVGSYRNNSGNHGFLYSGGTYTTIDDPLGIGGSYAAGINDAGQIAGGFNGHGFLYSNGTFRTLDDPSASTTSPTAINASGQIVGVSLDILGSGSTAFSISAGYGPE